MNLKELSAIFGVAIFLGACGGSGSSSSATDVPGSQGSTTPEQPTQPTNPPSTSGLPIEGVSLVVKGSNTAPYNVVGNDMNYIHLDGRDVPLVLPGISSGSITTIGGPISANGMTYQNFLTDRLPSSIYGALGIEGDGELQSFSFFSQGRPTTEMPQSGTATYRGNAFLQVLGGNYTVGQSQADVNFADRKVAITIAPSAMTGKKATFDPASFEASIVGNKFMTKTDSNIVSNGRFYGENANELGGVFANKENEFKGSFGAIKAK